MKYLSINIGYKLRQSLWALARTLLPVVLRPLARFLFLLMLLASCHNKQERRATFMPDMYESPAYKTYGQAPLLPPEHSVKRGELPYAYPNTLEGYEQAKATLQNPLIADTLHKEENLIEGKKLYSIYCALCHGDKGEGNGILVTREKIFGVPNYKNRESTQGSIYHVIYYGRNAMPSLATQLSEKERWQVTMYVEQLTTNK